MQKKSEPIFYMGGWAVATMGFLLIAQENVREETLRTLQEHYDVDLVDIQPRCPALMKKTPALFDIS
jgi:hypothetical protein